MQVIYNQLPLMVSQGSQRNLGPTELEVRTTYVPILRYDGMQLGRTKKVLGYGGVGRVEKVGALRSENWLNKRVLFMNPMGTWQTVNYPMIPPYNFEIPENVSDQSAAAIIGGADIALVLAQKIQRQHARQVIILGANSVVGLSLMQILRTTSNVKIVEKVRPQSQAFFNDFCEQINFKLDTEVFEEKTVVIDLAKAGYLAEINAYQTFGYKVWSIARNDIMGVQFISEPLLPHGYQKLLEMLAEKTLVMPLAAEYDYRQVNLEVLQNSGGARGRKLLKFN